MPVARAHRVDLLQFRSDLVGKPVEHMPYRYFEVRVRFVDVSFSTRPIV